MSYQLSTNKDLSLAVWSPFGEGKSETIVSKISSTPSPVFPEQDIALEVSIPITSSICFLTLSTSDAGRSILFSTGIIWWFVSSAWYTFARVWASTPCELSTIRTEPSQASSDLLTS